MNVTDPGSAEASYYAWVDQFDTFGLGRNVPIGTGNANEALLALVNGKFVILRVPYPMGFYAKWMDGRIDDPNAGWKGKGLWSTYATRTPFHVEGGKGTTSKDVKFQLRPDPLARGERAGNDHHHSAFRDGADTAAARQPRRAQHASYPRGRPRRQDGTAAGVAPSHPARA